MFDSFGDSKRFTLEQSVKVQRRSRSNECFTLSVTTLLGAVGVQHHASAALLPGKRPFTHCVGPRACEKNLAAPEIRSPDHQGRSF